MSADDLQRRLAEARAAVLRASALTGRDEEIAFAAYCAVLNVHSDDAHHEREAFAGLYARARADVEAAADSKPARRLDLDALLDAPLAPIPWRVDKFAADGCITVLAGHGGDGKSWISLALAIGVACGSTVAGLTCTTGRALYIDGENGERTIARRYRAAAGRRQGVAIYEADAIDLGTDAGATWLRDTITQEQANLVFLDSLRALAPNLEENNGDTVAPVMHRLRRVARQTGAALVLLHHRPKNGGAAYRGSSVLRDQADVLFVLGRDEKDPENATRRYLHADGARGGKMRIDAEPAERWIHLRTLGEHVTIDAAQPYQRTGQTKRPAAHEELADDLARLLQATPAGLTRSELARAVNRPTNDGTVQRALEHLRDHGTAKREGQRGPWIHTGTPEQTTLDEVASHPGYPAGDPAGGVASQHPSKGAGYGYPPRLGTPTPDNALTADTNDGRTR